MRILDIGVAAGYAILCISLISLLSPYEVEGAEVTAVYDARASSAIAACVQAVGLPYLGSTPPAGLCSSLQTASNSTIVLSGIIDGVACQPSPRYFIGSSSFEFMVSGRQVEIEAWVEGQ